MDSDNVTESNLSLKSRSFLNRVNDRLRKILMQYIDKRSKNWGMLMSWTLKASVFIKKITQKTYIPSKNTGKDFTSKQMFDLSEKLITKQSCEIFGSVSNQLFGHNWRRVDGIRVEYFPRINLIAARRQSPRVTVKIERNTRQIYWTDHLHVDVQRHLMEMYRQWTRMHC